MLRHPESGNQSICHADEHAEAMDFSSSSVTNDPLRSRGLHMARSSSCRRLFTDCPPRRRPSLLRMLSWNKLKSRSPVCATPSKTEEVEPSISTKSVGYPHSLKRRKYHALHDNSWSTLSDSITPDLDGKCSDSCSTLLNVFKAKELIDKVQRTVVFQTKRMQNLELEANDKRAMARARLENNGTTGALVTMAKVVRCEEERRRATKAVEVASEAVIAIKEAMSEAQLKAVEVHRAKPLHHQKTSCKDEPPPVWFIVDVGSNGTIMKRLRDILEGVREPLPERDELMRQLQSL